MHLLRVISRKSKSMKFITCIVGFLIALTGIGQTNTPSVINSAGGSAKAGYYQFEWSIGESALINSMTNSDNTYVVTNGFLQPYTLFPVFNNPSNQFGADEIKVFPSPASSYVEINFFTKHKGKIQISFYDAAGKRVFAKELQGNGVDIIERIPVSHFASGMYSLNVELVPEPGSISKKGVFKLMKIN